jgi:hypothetical protein
MFNITYLLINIIILMGIGFFVSQTYFFIQLTSGGSARHLRGCLEW